MPLKKQPIAPAPVSNSAPEVVDPKWLLKALGGAVIAALAFAYLATCILFYKAQWQLVLKPAHTESHQPAEYGMTAESVSFGPDEAGKAQLNGWVLPAASAEAPWVLMLPAGEGSAGDCLERAHTFHGLGYQVLLFDYRGFGASLGKHPTEAQMEKDSEDALTFLGTRPGFHVDHALVYGRGLGASLATPLMVQHPQLAGLVLEQADGDTASRARLDPRAKPVPFDLLFHENFPLADPLHSLNKPKLLISYTTGSAPEVLKRAADPKMLLEVSGENDPAVEDGVKRFLDMYLPRPTDTLIPGAP